MAKPYCTAIRPSLTASVAILSGGVGIALLLAVGWRHLGIVANIAIVSVFVRASIVGRFLAWIAQRTCFSWKKTAALLAALSCLLAILAPHYFAFQAERAEALSSQSEFLKISADPDIHGQDFQDQASGLTFYAYGKSYFGFVGQAKDSASAILGPKMGLGFFLIELLFGMLVAAYYPAGVANEPVCAKCGRWLPERRLIEAAHGTTPAFIAALLRHESESALDMLAPPDTEEKLIISIAQCPCHPQEKGEAPGDAVLRLREEILSRRGRLTLLRHRADLLLSTAETKLVLGRGGQLRGE